jgi:hypothetical protein
MNVKLSKRKLSSFTSALIEATHGAGTRANLLVQNDCDKFADVRTLQMETNELIDYFARLQKEGMWFVWEERMLDDRTHHHRVDQFRMLCLFHILTDTRIRRELDMLISITGKILVHLESLEVQKSHNTYQVSSIHFFFFQHLSLHSIFKQQIQQSNELQQSVMLFKLLLQERLLTQSEEYAFDNDDRRHRHDENHHKGNDLSTISVSSKEPSGEDLAMNNIEAITTSAMPSTTAVGGGSSSSSSNTKSSVSDFEQTIFQFEE